jgi:hypothetical protein
MPVLGDAGVVSSILNFVLKLASATSATDIFSHSVSLIRAATSEPSMPTTFCASQWPCGSVLLGDFGIGGMLIGEGEAVLCQ